VVFKNGGVKVKSRGGFILTKKQKIKNNKERDKKRRSKIITWGRKNHHYYPNVCGKTEGRKEKWFGRI